jgi:serine phosphatase RsbU (regulator of sigma subunit)
LPIYLKNKVANKDGELFSAIKGSRTSIGGFNMENKTFEEKTINLNPYSHFYLFSDGYQDQLGGEKGKRIGRKRFYNFISETSEKSIGEQLESFKSFLNEWQPKEDRNDDITIIGVEL